MKVSDCCVVPVLYQEDGDALCLECGEHCETNDEARCAKCGRELDAGTICRECDAGIREDIADGKRDDAAAEGGK